MSTIAEPSGKSLIISMQCQGKEIAKGTCFIVQSKSGPVMITNRHIVTGLDQETGQLLNETTGAVPDEIAIVHHSTKRLGSWEEKAEPLRDSNGAKWIEHPTLGCKADFVALPLTQTDDIEIYEYDLNDSGPLISYDIAENISVIGFPFGLTAGGYFPIWINGFIASEPEIDYKNLSIFLIDCRTCEGNSGSPVISYRCRGTLVTMENGNSIKSDGPVYRFLGIYSGSNNEKSDIGIDWKRNAIKELVDSI